MITAGHHRTPVLPREAALRPRGSGTAQAVTGSAGRSAPVSQTVGTERCTGSCADQGNTIHSSVDFHEKSGRTSERGFS